jgi:hypothetical protein
MFTGPNTVTDGLVLALDAANSRSYPGTGTTWNDLSGNGNSGTLINGPTFDANNNGSIVFDGVDDLFVVNLNTSINFTIDVVVKPDLVSSAFRETIAAAYVVPHTDGTFILNYETNDRIRFFVNTTSGQYSITSPSSAITQNVTNIVGTFNGFNITLYINGVQVSTTTITSSQAILTNDFRLFSRGIVTSPDRGRGTAYIARYYNRALTPDEILQNYNATKSRFNL